MENSSQQIQGFYVVTQLPLDPKSSSPSENDLKNLGLNNTLAFCYPKGLIVDCLAEESQWVWREAIGQEQGLLLQNFIYPLNHSAGDIDYSLKPYNFFKRKIIELDDKLDKSTYTGNAQDLADAIDAIEELQFPDVVLKIGEIDLIGLSLSIDANAFAWRINKIEFTTPPAYATALNQASNGFFRYDILQGNANGQYSIKSGVESVEIGTPPIPDPNCIALTDILIFGDNIQEILITNTNNFNIFGNGGDLDYVFVNSSANLFYVFNTLSIAGVTIPQQYLTFGKDYYIRNNEPNPITLKSAVGTNNIQFYFPEGDLILPGFNTIHCKYLPDGRTNKGYFALIGINNTIELIQKEILPKLQFIANGTDSLFNLGTNAKVKTVFWNGALLNDNDFSQLNNILTLTFIPANGDIIKPI
jgi:hypothetical protein